MSWLRDDYEAFEKSANTSRSPSARQWSLLVWDVTEGAFSSWHPANGVENQMLNLYIQRHACESSRWSFAPLHGPERQSLPDVLDLFRILHVPTDFSMERTRAVCHSFGHRTDDHGTCSWFHFLCKNISVKREDGKTPEVDMQMPSRWGRGPTLPQADYSWLVSSFFMRVHDDGSVVLACFGARHHVRTRIEAFALKGTWHDVAVNPYVLFDLILDGLWFEVDETVWNMNSVFGSLEHVRCLAATPTRAMMTLTSQAILEIAHTKEYAQLNTRLSFAALHNCAKHIIYLSEGLEACLLVVDEVLDNCDGDWDRDKTSLDGRTRVLKQLKGCLRYRRSLYLSTQLRLGSLQKRIDNFIALAFNVVTQKDSMVVTRDSSVMKVIAAITIVFLPTTGIATVAGSQLLVSEWQKDSNSWTVRPTPLFWLTWWIAIPVTVCVLLMTFAWQWYMNSERAQSESRRLSAMLKARLRPAETRK
ncbi:hypothetical protein RJ55_05340 [Drechmeria coniospora]|nr:hypothetical protein RJ55_05340 [Drechmeria coniospora]